MLFQSKLKRLLLVAVAAVGSSAFAQGFADCPQYFVNGKPPVITGKLAVTDAKLRELCFDGFAVLHSGTSKTPVYAVEHMSAASLEAAASVPRVDRFYEEARLPMQERALLSDYRASGFDRGHMFPAASAATPESAAQSFSLANMVPQEAQLNRGAWARNVEAGTRNYARRSKNGVYVYTGPIYDGPRFTIGAGRVWVPSKLFKLVYDQEKNKAWAHVLPNDDTAQMRPPISYQELVAMTGIEFLPKGANPKGP